MKRAVTLLSILMLLNGCERPLREAAYSELEWRDDVYSLQGEPFTGIARDHHPDGKLKGEYPFRKGRFHGVVREWWENGQLSTETHFENGQRHGSNQYWSKDGKLMKEQIYNRDKSVSEKHHEVR